MKNKVYQIGTAVLVGLAAFALFSTYARPNVVHGNSMATTIEDGDIVLVEKVSVVKHNFEHGDIVLLTSDLEINGTKHAKLTKRIIGLPGDHIEIKDGLVYLNGKMILESYLSDGGTIGKLDRVVPRDHLFVLGDNRLESIDSRHASVGFVPVEAIDGKAYLRVFPFRKFGDITHD
ncbi:MULTISPECIES: signal peptidase I [unclassified Fusibacter]|uniref:signal peptidase I n=1 Tax=unclassified Fusibacter TaxID=2624464 RepID=UPI0013E93986|nr:MULTISPECIES: signal peptidase I [unclassified Fusibacter]MCK8060980.1 signal peptidase I [Fusibacter sp. A2]NPE20566.1 signal peptidase I [Fusibacter sp. A1]